VAVGTRFTVAVAGALVPPAPVQISEYMVAAFTAPVLCVPLAASEPVQPPDAAQDVALVELQVNVDVPPADTAVGAADSVAVGIGRILTVALAGVLVPPAPAQTSEYTVAAVNGPVLRLPLAAKLPLQPPEAVQDVALVELQVSVDEPPVATLEGEALTLAVGAAGKGLTVTDAAAAGLVPPGPEQVNEKVELAVSAPVLCEPLAASVPLQLPAARHAVA
jgi:hypothetical protein